MFLLIVTKSIMYKMNINKFINNINNKKEKNENN